MKLRTVVALGMLLQVLGGCGSSSQSVKTVDEDEPLKVPREAKVELPAFPGDGDLIEFYPGAVGGHRYFIDSKSLLVGKDRIVRYAMVMRTTGGAVNVTYEGIHCQTREQRLYAIGYRGKGWVEARNSHWEPIRRGRFNDHQMFLYSEYFCHDGVVPVDKASILGALRRGLSGPSPHRGDR